MIQITSSQCKLCSICHHIYFIKNDQFQIAISKQKLKYFDRLPVPANPLISSRTILIPLSSLALSSRVISEKSFPQNYFAIAMIVEVFPVPGGPQNSKLGRLLYAMNVLTWQKHKYWYEGSTHVILSRRSVEVCTSKPMEVHLTCSIFPLPPSAKIIYRQLLIILILKNHISSFHFHIMDGSDIIYLSETSKLMSNNQIESVLTSEQQQKNLASPLEDIIQQVGSNGPYQIKSFLIFSLMWFIVGWLLLGGSFFFDDTFTCFKYNSQQCLKQVCSLPPPQRTRLIKNHAKSIVFQFQNNYLICDDRNYLISILQSTVYVGSLLGFFCIPYLADNWGRVIGMKISWVICTIGVIILTIADSVNMIGLGYLLAGFGSNPAITLCYSFINQQCLGHPRQRYGAAIQIFFGLGECVIGLLFIGLAWRQIIYIVLAVVLLMNILLVYLIQTPKFKIKEGKKSLLVVLNQIAQKNKKPTLQLERLDQLDLIDESENPRKNVLLDLFRYRSLLWITISTGVTFAGIQAIYYSTVLNLGSAGYSKLINQEFIGISQMLGYIIAEFIIPLVRRKRASIFGMGISALMCLLLALLTSFKNDDNENIMKLFQTIGLVINRMVLCCFWVIFYVYVAELYPTSVRSLGFGWTSAIGMIGSTISPYILLISDKIGLNSWIVPGILGFISLAFIFCLPETLNKNLKDQISQLQEAKMSQSLIDQAK